MLILTGTEDEIVAAIDTFNVTYHNDYFRVRASARAFYQNGKVSALAHELVGALESWGAGRRKAPAIAPHREVVATLRILARRMETLSNIPHGSLHFAGAERSTDPRVFARPSDLDRVLFEVLSSLATGCFVGNTSVTYPTKALLLLTGIAPALDSQVRRGLRRAGYSGFDKTSYPLPFQPCQADYKRLAMLPFLVGDFWRRCGGTLARCAQRSNQIALRDEPGRMLDVLLFSQARGTILVEVRQTR